ncbi:hypothetical protein MTR67_022125 [Solanum verrucosum]|uniref:Cytochrome P450 n=1 Tax=Solanum verrucosum TaxID=315347 RepID=A0AAF0QX76_SOLVR|nr:hypothetical protein MTR67_022125 [Solanum verrucosum]
MVDAVVKDVINEHKKNIAIGKTNGALGGEDLIDVLIRLMNDGGLQFPITNDNIKAIIFDMFAAGTETSSAMLVWAMVRMMKNPSVFVKSQAEVREAFKDKETFDENDVEELKYLKEETDINGYTIPVKTKVMVNVWALGRDLEYWDDAVSFKPERFEQCSVDFSCQRDLSNALSTLLVTILSIFPLAVGEGFLPGYHLA